MTQVTDDTVAALRRTIAELEQKLDASTVALSEAQEQQSATAEILEIINSSGGDLAPVFDAMLEKAMRLCEAAFGVMFIVDGDHLRIVAERQVPTALSSYMADQPPQAGPLTFLGQAMRVRKIVHTPDALEGEPYRKGVPLAVKTVELGGVRALLMAPLLKNEAILGLFAIFRQEVRPFTDKQIAVLESFAAQAVIAIENARLLGELRQRTDDLQESLKFQTATSDVLKVISRSTFDLNPVLENVMETAVRLCRAEHGSIFRLEGDVFRWAVGYGLEPAYREIEMSTAITPGKGTVVGRVALYGKPVQIVDAWNDPDYAVKDEARIGNARTMLGVPLLREGTLIGVIAMARRHLESFTEKEIELVSTFADQAVIAIENVRLLTEQREALDQQTATAEVLQVINSSPGDLALIFDAMLEKATALCGAAYGALVTYDGERFTPVAAHGVPTAFEVFRSERGSFPPPPGSSLARVAKGENLVHIADVMADPSQAATPLVELGGCRALVCVALRKDETLVGAITAYRQEVRPFTDKQIALLENFAAQAVIATENARLITETREALDQQTATAEVLGVINSSPGDLTPVFDAMLEKALDLCSAAFGVLWTYDGEFTHAAAIRGATAEYREFLSEPHRPGPGSAQLRLIHGERFVHVADLADSDDYRSGDALPRALVDLGGGRSLLAVPLRKDGAYLGAIMIYRQEPSPFSDKQIALLQNFAAQAVIAMENARLLDEIRQRQAELRVTFDNMADGVVMFDEDLRLAAWNRNFQELLDLPDAALAERPSYAEYLRILAERGEFGMEDIEAELNRRLENADQELRLERTRPDGRVIEVRRNAVPEGGFVLIYSDITERKRSEAEIRAARDVAEATLCDLRAAQANLIQAEKMASLGQLTAGIAHEIKNPLNFVNNFAGLSVELLDELRETTAPAVATLAEDKRAEVDETMVMLSGNLEKIAEHGKRADNIVKSMLEHSRGVTGERREVDLNNLIEEALNLAYHGARAQDQNFNITLERDYGATLKPVELAPQEITRVFLNLFGNGFYAANKRSHENGNGSFRPSLTVATRDTGDAVEVRVRDNGTGIPPEIKDKLFQPFFTTKPTGEGTGLGLSISYDIITQQHGGTIEVDSRVGEFTEFTVRLPRAYRASSAEAAS